MVVLPGLFARGKGWPVLDVTCDDKETPAIDLVHEGYSPKEVVDYLSRPHRPTLVLDAANQYRGWFWVHSGAFWARRWLNGCTGELGSDQKQAASAFRKFLREAGLQ